MVRVDVDREGLRNALLGPEGQGVRWGERVGRRVANNAKVNLTQAGRVDKNRLRSSIDFTVTVDRAAWRIVVIIGTDVEYARYVHDGTGIYGPKKKRIYPVTAKVLAWPIPGPKHFAASVRGIKATPFLTDALEEVFPGQVRERG